MSASRERLIAAFRKQHQDAPQLAYLIDPGPGLRFVAVNAAFERALDLREAAVVGQPDDRWGEVAVAAVVRQSGSTLDEAAVMARFHERIARFKHPRRVFFLDSLPKNAMGKVQKTELQRVLAERAGADPAERPSTNL